MSELRRDPIIGQWVVVQKENSLGPESYEKEDQTIKHMETCQFCPGKEYQTPPEVDAIRKNGSKADTPDWQVRVVPNKFPALKIEGDLDERKEGLFDMSNGIGAHEVLIETPDHEKNFAEYTQEEVSNVIKQYQSRIIDLTGDKRFKYILIFKNYGESAGTSVEHAHSQIIALPMIPKYVAEKIDGAKAYYDQNQHCVFCDIIEQEHQDQNRILLENDDYIAFCPFVPRYAFEFWIVPKRHDSTFVTIDDNGRDSLAAILKETLLRLKNCLSNPSYNFYIHNAPVNAGDQKAFHWHIEIVPKLTRTTGFELGTGFYFVRTSPEAAAGYLRNVENP